ncbi:MAG: hypothetical protein K6A65_02485 [Succinivibrionaceae bacterium]|nr:hypothetical protein [Succinivibrionaceae bacterium]
MATGKKAPSDQEARDKAMPVVGQVIAAVLPMAGLAAAAGLVKKGLQCLTVTNLQHSDVSGNNDLHPRKSETSINDSRNAAATTDGSVAKNEVKGQDGNVTGSASSATAAKTDAQALNADAEAVKTRAGATNISTTALGIN